MSSVAPASWVAACGAHRLIEMDIRGAGNHHALDRRISQGRIRVHGRGTAEAGQSISRRPIRIDDVLQVQVRVRLDVIGVNLTDATGSEKGNVQHGRLSVEWNKIVTQK